MPSDKEQPRSVRDRIATVMGETLAPTLWAYTALKLLVFDIDRAFLLQFAPQYTGLLNYKFFFLLGGAAIAVATLGGKNATTIAIFVALYPVVLAWRIAKRCVGGWPIVVVFLPVIEGGIRRFRSTFILYTVAIFAALATLLATRPLIVMAGVVCLAPLLIFHVIRAVNRAYRGGPFQRLVDLLKMASDRIEAGTVVQWLQETAAARKTKSTGDTASTVRSLAYSAHLFGGWVTERVRSAAMRGYYDLFLFGSLLYTVLLVTVIFAFAHFGIYRAIPDSYTHADDVSFWSFLGMSASIFVGGGLSQIGPNTPIAVLLSYAENICRYGMFVLGGFLLISAARENYKKGLEEFTDALTGVVASLEKRITIEWQLTVAQLEIVMLTENAAFVNLLRTVRGLPELPTPTPPLEGEVVSDREQDAGQA